MSLLTDALQLQEQKKPRAIQFEALPPFSAQPSRTGIKLLAWILGLILAVGAGIWQGPALWSLVETAMGMQRPTSPKNPPIPLRSTAPEALPPVSGDRHEMLASTKPLPTPAPTQPPSESATSATLQPIVVPFQAADMDEVAAAAQKMKEKREQTVRELQIQGVRMQGQESRALVDGVPLGLGEAVGKEGLRLKAIEPSRLLFEDPDGVEYIKSY